MLKFWWVINVIVQTTVFVTAQHPINGCCPNMQIFSYLETAVMMINRVQGSVPPCPMDEPINQDNFWGKPTDCIDVLHLGGKRSGVYTIWPKSRVMDDEPLDVYCDMDTADGGWTVIQRRGNFSRPKDYFYKDWKSYKEGFGDIEKDFWLGNDNIFALSNQRLYSVRFDLKDVEGNKTYALYDMFWIDDEDHNYTLHIKDYSGDAGDSMIGQHDNQKFSTKDRKNDNQEKENCAQKYKGGWWYNICHTSNLNGLYLAGKHKSFADGVVWLTFKGYRESMDTTEIKIRPKNFRKENSENLYSGFSQP